MVEAVDIRAMLDAIMSAPKREPDTLFMSPFYYDTLKVEVEIQNRFAGRNWRRIKRERRKAHDLVKWKHRNKGRVMFAIDKTAMGFDLWRSSPLKVGEW